jgi:hypothetical protein
MEKSFYSFRQALAEGKTPLVMSAAINTAGSPAVPERRPDLPQSCNTALLPRRSLQCHCLARGKFLRALTIRVALTCRDSVTFLSFRKVFRNAPTILGAKGAEVPPKQLPAGRRHPHGFEPKQIIPPAEPPSSNASAYRYCASEWPESAECRKKLTARTQLFKKP